MVRYIDKGGFVYELLTEDLVNKTSKELIELAKKIEHLKGYDRVVVVESSVMVNPYHLLVYLSKTINELDDRKTFLKWLTISIIFFLGLRESEYTLLTKDSFDFISKTVKIKTLKQKNRTFDYIPLEHVPGSLLKVWQISLLKLSEKELFKISRVAVWKRVKTFLEREFNGIRTHSLRHGFGLLIYETTKDIRLTAQLLRHRNIKNTLIYTKLSQDEIRERLRKVFSLK